MPETALQGIRILELGTAWAGPVGTMLLTTFGAEVVKIESRVRPDFSRRVYGQGDLDMAPNFQDINTGKLSVALNLQAPRARELALQLAAISDVFMTNMRPGVPDKLELGYERVKEVRPDIIYLSSSASGASGPEREYVGFAPTFGALGGLSHLTGSADAAPLPVAMPVDIRAGYTAALAILVGLNLRQRTGQGSFIDLSSTEAIAALIGHTIVDYSMNKRNDTRHGNRDDVNAPQGCYRCREAESWVSISIGSDVEWTAFCEASGHSEWAADEHFQDAVRRRRHHDELDELIEGWTCELTDYEVMNRLQSAGVAAVPSFNPAQLWGDPHTNAREAYASVEHPKLGKRTVLSPPWHFSATPANIRMSGPLLGQHTDYVLGELLNLSPKEVQRLKDDEIAF
jgi:benzylsuccinate CoA-transferase BbsF subunit